MRSTQLLTELYRAGKTEERALANIYELELALEEANRAVGRFEFDRAAEILITILQHLSTVPRNDLSLKLRARCLVLLANIRRDQGRLLGLRGAITLYQQAKEIWQHVGAKYELAKLSLYLGACCEMQRDYSQALKYYSETIERAEAVGGVPSLKARALLRIGTVLTKTKALDEADSWLVQGIREFESRTLIEDHGLAKQKLAILRREQGNLDEALDLVTETALVISETDSFRITQTKILTADLLLSAGEEDQALKQMAAAESLAFAHGFYHQLNALHTILDRYSENEALSVRPGAKGLVVEGSDQQRIYRDLCDSLSLGQLHELCHRLHIDYQNLSGVSQSEKIASLLVRVRLLDQWDAFVEQMDQMLLHQQGAD